MKKRGEPIISPFISGCLDCAVYHIVTERDDVTVLTLPEDKRKDTEERRKFLNAADLVFLCLPDAAAMEAVSLIDNPNTRVIDASTAHRTADGWVYGFAELLAGQRERIKNAKRVANPGCHASGFISTVCPLVANGVIPSEFPLTAYSLTGYSGGGKSLIAEYEAEDRDPRHGSCRIYGTTLAHKHLPEMTALPARANTTVTGL